MVVVVEESLMLSLQETPFLNRTNYGVARGIMHLCDKL